jgi:hypothetical protein
MALIQPTFHVDGDVIHITSGYDRRRRITLIVTAVFLAIFPVIRPLFPKDTYVAYEHGEWGAALWLFGIFACASAAFWWSTVVIDTKADELVIRSRWGLFCSDFRRPLSSYGTLTVRDDGDGRVSVCLENPTASGFLGLSTSKAIEIVWGREKEETETIARSLASHLKLELSIHRAASLPKIHL